MKSKSNVLPQQFDIGALLINDEVFAMVRRKLRPETYFDQDLSELVKIMIQYGNSIEAIHAVNPWLAIYAMELANHVASWQIKCKLDLYESIKEEPKKGDLAEMVFCCLNDSQKKYIDSESFRFLVNCLELFLKDKKNFEENKQGLALAKDNFEPYCELKERIEND